MFCPQCSQAFNARGVNNCPNCKFSLNTTKVPKNDSPASADFGNRSARKPAIDCPKVNAGISQGTKFIIIAVAFFPVYLVLHSFYPANDFLIRGQRSADMFDTAGKAILLTLLLAGLARVAYALLVQRRAS